MPLNSASRTAYRIVRGFTMIEVLVTLVIMMIGLLGIAGLMAQGQRSSFEAYQRQQALALASDMAERVKANRQGVDDTVVTAANTYAGQVAITGDGTRYSQLIGGGITNCATASCTAAQTVVYDAAIWDGLLFGRATETDVATGAALGPILNARGCIQQIATSACPAPGGPPASRQVTYKVSVAWQGSFPTSSPKDFNAQDTCGENLYRFQNLVNDAARRMVSVDVYTVLACP